MIQLYHVTLQYESTDGVLYRSIGLLTDDGGLASAFDQKRRVELTEVELSLFRVVQVHKEPEAHCKKQEVLSVARLSLRLL